MTFVRVTERAIQTSNGKWATVHYPLDDTGKIVIRWPCGDTFAFTKDDLGHALDSLEQIKKHEGVWLTHKDSQGVSFRVKILQDTFVPAANGERGASVPYKRFRKLLQRGL